MIKFQKFNIGTIVLSNLQFILKFLLIVTKMSFVVIFLFKQDHALLLSYVNFVALQHVTAVQK